MREVTPARTLLVDLGGTLVGRSRPGPVTRALTAIADSGDLAGAREQRDILARCLLTGDDRKTGIERVTAALGLAGSRAAALRDAIAEPEGEQFVLPHATELLAAARSSGWRTVAVSNVARWCDELPSQIAAAVDQVVTSCDVGVCKQDEAFWHQLISGHGIEPKHSVVVGDSPVPDMHTPGALGFCAVLVGPEGRPLAEVADWVRDAAALPEEALGAVAGTAVSWAGQPTIPAPHLDELVLAMTRYRVRVSLPGGRIVTSTVVRRRSQPPALLLPAAARNGGILWLAPVADRRNSIIPADLLDVLARENLSLDVMSDHERRHLVSMVREAKDESVRQLRIEDIVTFLRANAQPAGGSRA